VNKSPTDSKRCKNNTDSGVRTWLTRTNHRPPTAPDQLSSPSHPSAENHYTPMDETYSPISIVDEALYAELDGESIKSDNSSTQHNQYSQEVSFQKITLVDKNVKNGRLLDWFL
jgi:hypothetical protein